MAHENPIQIRGEGELPKPGKPDISKQNVPPPKALDLKRDEKLTITWQDGSVSEYPVLLLRRMSPSADARVMREQIKSNPLTVLSSSSKKGEPFHVTSADFVGNYAIRLCFSDGHDTGIYSWRYLKAIDPANGPVNPDELLGL